ncbi:uncharacterized protein LOC120039828 [Salvelinus namaycush]|uniref:Uncharacterized protein LOC120039828 n=1 Tax=Salvelinus namaycush TaxID=8040 RepID=A0A8U0QD30_SALNM|nr:uncharacterized protein LOC120039828 [Salvelinus namaycush]XP_038841127.1 uncharacterized protein LOC120039828 [Salvelinus namaycush]
MRGVVLLFLLSLWPGGQVDAINQEVLANVVQEMRRFGLENRQYAMAVLLTHQQCTQNGAIFDVVVQPQVVQNSLQQNGFYIGARLIAAIPDTYHAEYRLLSHVIMNPSPMDTLINIAHHDDCIVFFSNYSPCLERCNFPDGETSILPFMTVFNSWNANRKAFVFSSVWDPTKHHPGVTNPSRQQVFDSFRRIDGYLHLYRCVRFQEKNIWVNRCYRCVTDPETNDCLYGY